jgi:hypothetical protein
MAIQTLINEKFNGEIWRMEIDDRNELLFLEVRNSDDRRVSFASFSLQTGQFYFKDFTRPEHWLTGMEAAYDEVLLLHQYQSDTSPVHKGVIAIDGITGETLWSNYNYAFDHLSDAGLVLFDSRIQPRKMFTVDIKTGDIKKTGSLIGFNDLESHIVYPNTVDLSLLPAEFAPFNTCGKTAHCLEFNNLIFVSLHTFTNEVLKQLLYVFENGHRRYEDLLAENVQKLQPESFIMHKNRLIYVKNKSELKVLAF